MASINESLTVDLTLKTQQWQGGLNKATKSSNKFVDSMNGMNQKLTKMLIEMKKVGRQGSTGINKADKSIKKLNKSAKIGQNAIGGMKTALVSFAVSAGGLSFFSSAISSAREFETSIREVMTILPQGSLSMQQTEKIVNDLALSMGEDAPKAARAMYQAISAGVEPKKAKAFLEDAATLAIAGVTNLETSVDLLTSVTNAYGLEIENAGALSDSLFETVRLGKTTVAELAATMGRVAPTASSAGVGIIEVEASLAALTSAGVKTKEAGTQIVAMLNAVISPSEDAATLARELGIEFSAQALEAQGLEGFLQQVAQATGNDIEMMARLFPSVRGLGGVLNLTGKVADKFSESIDSITNSGGKAKKGMQEMAAGFAFNMGTIESAAKQGQAGVGKNLVSMLFDVKGAGDQSAVFALKIKAFFKDVEVGVGFLVNQVFRRAIVGLKFLGMNAVNVGRTLADAFNVAVAEIKVVLLKLQVAANSTMDSISAFFGEEIDFEFANQLKAELNAAEKLAKRSIGDVASDAVRRFKGDLRVMSKGVEEINRKHKQTIASAAEGNELRREAEALTKKITKAATDQSIVQKNIAAKLKSQTDLLKQQKAIKKALANSQAKEDRAFGAEGFAFEMQLAIERALNNGLSQKSADGLFKFVETAINKGTEFSTIEEQFNEKLNEALTGGAIGAVNETTRQTKAALNNSSTTIARTARETIEGGFKSGLSKSRLFFSEVLTLTLKQAMEDTKNGLNRLPSISDTVATLNFKTEREGRDSLRASNFAARSSLGFSNQAGFLPGDLLSRKPFGFSEGGEVKGPNVNRDVVSAQLTPGEYVINRQASQAFLPLLQAINKQTITPQAVNNNVNLGGINIGSQGGGLTDEMIDNQIVPRLRQLIRFNRF